MLRKHPGTILAGWSASTWRYMSLTEFSPVKSHYFVGVCYDPVLQEQLGIRNWDAGNYAAKGVYHVSMRIPGIRTLQVAGLYSWGTLLMVLWALLFRKVRKFLPCCLLLMMVLGACLLSPVNGYFRYAYPLVLSFPAVLAAMAGSAGRKRREQRG